jgi:hypothetical protein
MSRKLSVLCLSLVIVSSSYAGYVIGNFEDGNDGWGTWNGSGVSPSNNFSQQSTYGVTLGSKALKVVQSGWAQGLAVSLDSAGAAAMKASTALELDMSVAPSNDYSPAITAGYTQIYEVDLNASGPGWTAVATGTPLNFYWWGGSGARTLHLSVDISAFAAAMNSSPTWAQVIFALNTGGGAPPEMYFDNIVLTPEPMTIALLGLGGLFLRRRRR